MARPGQLTIGYGEGDDVVKGEHTRAQDQARNLERHLNARHPDTILFLARLAAGRPAADAAELTVVDEAGGTLAVRTAGETEAVRVAFPPVSGTDLRSRFGALLQATRAADPAGPLTSLELVHAAGDTRS